MPSFDASDDSWTALSILWRCGTPFAASTSTGLSIWRQTSLANVSPHPFSSLPYFSLVLPRAVMGLHIPLSYRLHLRECPVSRGNGGGGEPRGNPVSTYSYIYSYCTCTHTHNRTCTRIPTQIYTRTLTGKGEHYKCYNSITITLQYVRFFLRYSILCFTAMEKSYGFLKSSLWVIVIIIASFNDYSGSWELLSLLLVIALVS